MTQHRQNLRPKLKHQESSKRSGARADGPDRAEPTTACGGRRMAVRPAHTTVCACVASGFAVFARLFVFSCIFLLFCFYNVMYLDILKHPIHSIAFSVHSKGLFGERKMNGT